MISPAPVAGGCGGFEGGWLMSRQGVPGNFSGKPETTVQTLPPAGAVPGGRGPGSTPACAAANVVRARQRNVTTASQLSGLLSWGYTPLIMVPFCFDKAKGGPIIEETGEALTSSISEIDNLLQNGVNVVGTNVACQ